MARRSRLDAELVRRGLARSREHAVTLIAGGSTGGFTEVLLSRGAAEVVAVDVGYGELAWSLRTDDRVKVHERTNVRTLTPEAIDGQVDLVVADLSFISLRLVLRRPSAGGLPGWWPARCPVRLATWSSSCGCAATPGRRRRNRSVEQWR